MGKQVREGEEQKGKIERRGREDGREKGEKYKAEKIEGAKLNNGGNIGKM